MTAINAVVELRQLFPSRQYNLVEVNVTLADLEAARVRIVNLMHPRNTVMDFNISSILWFGARAKGMQNELTPVFLYPFE